MWIASTGGITRFDGVKFTNFNSYNASVIISNRITTLSEDLKGNIWVGTEDKGIYKYQQGKFINYSTDAGLPKAQIFNIIPTLDV
ncbi:MAG: hypothetical protein WAQ98_20965 [Blastocatellia bacterium]